MDKKIKNINIEFNNLTYSVTDQHKNGRKKILKEISGEFKSGEITAIMGPSGAGKTTLLNILTGFTGNGVKGYINLFDKSFGNKKYYKLCSYILQEDNLYPNFNVQETMMFAASLKIAGISKEEKELLIDNILNTLNLSCTKTINCDNLSGGQKKRLSIALELLDNPPILFLDEPTTGLDSVASADCIALLQNLAREGRTIVCTIHQPDATTYTMFDHIYVLADGYCVYQGSADNTISYLQSNGLQCPQYHNPADFLIEVAAGDYGDFVSHLKDNAIENRWRYKSDFMKYTILADGEKLYSETSSINSTDIQKRPSEWSKFWILVGRCNMHYYRDWTITHLKLVLHILCALLIGLMFGDSGVQANKSISNIGLLVFGVVYLWYTTLMPSILKFPLEIAVLKKETFNNWYKLRTYFFANLFITTPMHITFSTVYSTIIYFITKQPLESDRYFKYILIYILLTMAADGLGLSLGAIIDPVNGTFLGAILTCIKIILCGFLILWNDMPKFMYTFTHISTHSYTVEALVLSLYSNGRNNLICPYDEEIIYCHYKDPKFLMKELGMNPHNFDIDILIIILHIIILKGSSYFLLKRRLKIK